MEAVAEAAALLLPLRLPSLSPVLLEVLSLLRLFDRLDAAVVFFEVESDVSFSSEKGMDSLLPSVLLLPLCFVTSSAFCLLSCFLALSALFLVGEEIVEG